MQPNTTKFIQEPSSVSARGLNSTYAGSIHPNIVGQTTETKLAENQTESEEYDARKTKRRGRRNTILTSQRGARGNLVLGKPTLLGA